MMVIFYQTKSSSEGEKKHAFLVDWLVGLVGLFCKWLEQWTLFFWLRAYPLTVELSLHLSMDLLTFNIYFVL